jgi:hypothetical protein
MSLGIESRNHITVENIAAGTNIVRTILLTTTMRNYLKINVPKQHLKNYTWKKINILTPPLTPRSNSRCRMKGGEHFLWMLLSPSPSAWPLKGRWIPKLYKKTYWKTTIIQNFTHRVGSLPLSTPTSSSKTTKLAWAGFLLINLWWRLLCLHLMRGVGFHVIVSYTKGQSS